VIIEYQVPELGRHLIRDVVVEMDVRAEVVFFTILQLKLMMQVTYTHRELVFLLLRSELLSVEVAGAIRSAKLHVLSESEAEELLQVFVFVVNNSHDILKLLKYLVFVFVVYLPITDFLAVWKEVCGYR